MLFVNQKRFFPAISLYDASASATFRLTAGSFSYTPPDGSTAIGGTSVSGGTDTGITVSGLQCTKNAAAGWHTAVCNQSTPVTGTGGKYYFEVLINTSVTYMMVGIATTMHPGYGSTYLGARTFSEAWFSNNGTGQIYYNGGSIQSAGSTFTSGNVVGVVIDTASNNISYYKNNALVLTRSLSCTRLQPPSQGFVKSGGTWKPIKEQWVKSGGTWYVAHPNVSVYRKVANSGNTTLIKYQSGTNTTKNITLSANTSSSHWSGYSWPNKVYIFGGDTIPPTRDVVVNTTTDTELSNVASTYVDIAHNGCANVSNTTLYAARGINVSTASTGFDKMPISTLTWSALAAVNSAAYMHRKALCFNVQNVMIAGSGYAGVTHATDKKMLNMSNETNASSGSNSQCRRSASTLSDYIRQRGHWCSRSYSTPSSPGVPATNYTYTDTEYVTYATNTPSAGATMTQSHNVGATGSGFTQGYIVGGITASGGASTTNVGYVSQYSFGTASFSTLTAIASIGAAPTNMQAGGAEALSTI